jgi:hypothetical protein
MLFLSTKKDRISKIMRENCKMPKLIKIKLITLLTKRKAQRKKPKRKVKR